ncbi:response regulator transcription factor [bacterium]|nr:response regulator transcription factor [bacterium]
MSIRIVLVDDHKLFREGLKSLLANQKNIEVVGQANSGLEAMEIVQELLPDLVVMDIGMKNVNGIQATRQLKTISPDIKVLALSMHSNEKYVAEMLRAGASGYLVKDCAYEELVNAINTIMSGRVYLSPEIAGAFVKDFLFGSSEETPSIFSILTPRECEVLQLIAEGKTNKEIADELGVSIKTIDTHRQQIMKKLDIHNVAELTRYAIKMGLTPLDK